MTARGRTVRRYKDRSAKAIEQDFPHFVDIAVPPGGLGPRINAMYDFHFRNGIVAKRGHVRFGPMADIR